MAGLTVLTPDTRAPPQPGLPLLWLFHLPQPRDHAAAYRLANATLCDCLGLSPDSTVIRREPNHPPASSVTWQGQPLYFSLAYADNALLLGLCPGRLIGVDLLRIRPLPDWHEVSQLYLAPAVTTELSGMPPALRDAQFAQRWAELEARGKCLGLPLAEYSPARHQQLHSPELGCYSLTGLPTGLAGCAAILTPRSA